MRAVYVDSSLFLMALGPPSAEHHAARRYLDGAAAAVRMHASVETVQEVVFHRLRRSSRAEALAAGAAVRASLVLHDFDVEVLERSLELVRDTHLRGRDAVHAATALRAGLDTIVTFDEDFQGVPDLDLVHP